LLTKKGEKVDELVLKSDVKSKDRKVYQASVEDEEA